MTSAIDILFDTKVCRVKNERRTSAENTAVAKDGPTIPYAKLAHLERGQMKIKSSEEARSKLISWTTVPHETRAAAAGEDRGDRQILEIWEGEEEGPDGCDDVGTEGRGQGGSMGGREGISIHPHLF